MERIIADLEQRLERLGWLTHRHISGSADLQMVPAPVAVRQELALKSSLERPQWQEPVMDPPELRDVMSLAGRVLTIGANTATLVSLERWSTRFVLRLAYADLDHRLLRDRLHTQRERWRGWDDAGTQYRRRGGAGSAGHGLFTEDLVFEPGAPDQARTLTLCVDHDGETERLIVGLDAGPAPA